jgi:hypothetical protein
MFHTPLSLTSFGPSRDVITVSLTSQHIRQGWKESRNTRNNHIQVPLSLTFVHRLPITGSVAPPRNYCLILGFRPRTPLSTCQAVQLDA